MAKARRSDMALQRGIVIAQHSCTRHDAVSWRRATSVRACCTVQRVVCAACAQRPARASSDALWLACVTLHAAAERKCTVPQHANQGEMQCTMGSAHRCRLRAAVTRAQWCCRE